MLGKRNLYMTLAVFAIAFLYMPFAMRKSKRKANGTEDLHRKKVTHERYIFFFNNVFTRKKFRHIVTMFASSSSFDFDELQETCVNTFIQALGVSLAMPIFMLITVQDFVITGVAAIVGYMYFESTVERKYDNMLLQMNKELSYTMQSISDNYALTDDVTKAVRYCERDACLEKFVNKLYDVLNSEDRAKALYEFKRFVPVRLLSTLATTCYLTCEEGDSKDENGSSKFVTELTNLRLEADSKVKILTATDIAFKSLANLSLTGLVVTPIFDMFLLKVMPGTSIYIKGVYGGFEKTLMLLITATAYYLISLLRRPSVVNQVDRSEIIDALSKRKFWRNLAIRLTPKTFSAEHKWKQKLNGAMSSKDMIYIYTMKPLMSVLFMIFMFVALVAFTITAKINLWNNYDSLSAIKSSTEFTESMYRQLKQVDYEYMTSEEKMEDTRIREILKARVQGLDPLGLEQQIDRLNKKWDTYYSISFKWWYAFIIYLAGIAGWFTPEVSLLLRKQLVEYEAADDAMQLQSLMMVLQSTKFDVRKCLYWLAQESTIHKAPLWFAYLEYGSDPELALMRLKDSVSLQDMKRLVGKLEKAMYDMSIEDAFRDIVLDKQRALTVNEMLQQKTLSSKIQTARAFANMPLNVTLYFGFMAPIFILGFTQLMGSFSALQTM